MNDIECSVRLGNTATVLTFQGGVPAVGQTILWSPAGDGAYFDYVVVAVEWFEGSDRRVWKPLAIAERKQPPAGLWARVLAKVRRRP